MTDETAYRSRPTGIPGLKIIDPIRLQDRPIPPRRWLVDGLIPIGNVTMLSGDGGIGKSLLALQLLIACALGKPWIGRNTLPCKGFGLFCEDDPDELHRRLIPIAKHCEADLGDFEHMQLCSRVGLDNAMVTFDKPWELGETTGLFVQVMNHAVEFGAQLVVLDSLHDVFMGDENKRSHARQFIQELRTIAIEIDGAIVLTSHPSLSGRNTGTGEAGNTAWNNAVRSRLYLTKPDGEENSKASRDIRALKSMKANYAAAGGEILMTWKDGVFVAEPEHDGIFTTIAKNRAEGAFLACLDALSAQGRTVSEHRTATNSAGKVMATLPQANGCTARELGTAMANLFASGKIIVGQTAIIGSNRHPKRGIMRAAKQEELKV